MQQILGDQESTGRRPRSPENRKIRLSNNDLARAMSSSSNRPAAHPSSHRDVSKTRNSRAYLGINQVRSKLQGLKPISWQGALISISLLLEHPRSIVGKAKAYPDKVFNKRAHVLTDFAERVHIVLYLISGFIPARTPCLYRKASPYRAIEHALVHSATA